jgi:hypothetical protein
MLPELQVLQQLVVRVALAEMVVQRAAVVQEQTETAQTAEQEVLEQVRL